jgi:Transposase
LGIHEHTYYHWRKEYGGLKLDQAKRLKELELENHRLRKVVADRRRTVLAVRCSLGEETVSERRVCQMLE